ncbi:GntR family transcriptional regulator [Streptosporangium sp. NBC_01756]|uniref:GntR family transcriptional regulator n=1 Tax=Streptosporangium sp. NBC_01756 TaxID=2975950 RepID=UPI002DD9D6CA|nr:GntR family transcriptional regulator [Streptosporangium sp. NBC_01756]WSC84426.1 GntR family transcriptional regulator [Streptosporangium sp. NBC_01756]
MLDREGPVPVYKQVAELIHARITTGDLGPGEAVPSEAELEVEYNIAKTTARRVARELREQGLAYTVQGEGTFVGEPGTPRPADQIPVYQRIAAEIRRQIEAGELLPNRRVPSEKELMGRHGVAKATVRQAMAFLRDQGWVFTVQYRGTYVSQPEKWPAASE